MPRVLVVGLPDHPGGAVTGPPAVDRPELLQSDHPVAASGEVPRRRRSHTAQSDHRHLESAVGTPGHPGWVGSSQRERPERCSHAVQASRPAMLAMAAPVRTWPLSASHDSQAKP